MESPGWFATELSSVGEKSEFDLVVDDFRRRVPTIEVYDLGEMTQSLGYLFVRCKTDDPEGIGALAQSPYVSTVVSTGTNGATVIAAIPELQLRVLSRRVVQLQTRKIRKGTPVLILRGSQQNLEGRVVTCDNGTAMVHVTDPAMAKNQNTVVKVRVVDLEIWRNGRAK